MLGDLIMNIIARKTDFYLTDDFFKNIITSDYVDGVALDVVLNVDNEILVYNYSSSNVYTIQQFQNFSLSKLVGSNILSLEEALESIYENRRNIPIYLNLIPNTLSIENDEDLKALNKRNNEYVMELDKVLKRYSGLNIKMHSISRNLVLLLKKVFLKNRIGFVISVGDLSPTDVDYYVFPTYMIDDVIFKELVGNNKRILIFVEGESDLTVVTEKYTGDKVTEFSKSILGDLSFIVNQPVLLYRIFEE